MSGKQLEIADMKCWVFRMAQLRWNMPPKQCAQLFVKYDVLGFIEECYDLLSLNSYECVVNDIEVLLKNKGVVLNK